MTEHGQEVEDVVQVQAVFQCRSGYRVFARPKSGAKVLYMFLTDAMPFIDQELMIRGRCWTNDRSMYSEVMGRTDIPKADWPLWFCRTMYDDGFTWNYSGDLLADLGLQESGDDVIIAVSIGSEWRSGSKVIRIETIKGRGLDAKMTVSVVDHGGQRRAAKGVTVRSLLRGYDPV
jgi:hypothetical protein